MLAPSAPVIDVLVRLRRAKRSATREVARIRFELRGGVVERVLEEELVRRYLRDGYLLAGGLIPPPLVDAAVDATWEEIGARRDDRSTWSRLGPGPHVLHDPRLLATYTERMRAAAAQLAAVHVATIEKPSRAFTIHRVPREGTWRPNGAHLDYSLAPLRHRTFPLPFRIGAMTYLTDVPRQGGGTIVWPGSHRDVEALARREPGRYALLSALSADLGRLALGEGVELTPSRGDVLFHHPLLVHASSDNVSSVPRLALNHKW